MSWIREHRERLLQWERQHRLLEAARHAPSVTSEQDALLRTYARRLDLGTLLSERQVEILERMSGERLLGK